MVAGLGYRDFFCSMNKEFEFEVSSIYFCLLKQKFRGLTNNTSSCTVADATPASRKTPNTRIIGEKIIIIELNLEIPFELNIKQLLQIYPNFFKYSRKKTLER